MATEPKTRPAPAPRPGPDDARPIEVAFPGATLRIAQRHLLLESAQALAVVSSAPYGGGWLRTRRIFSSHVPVDVDCSDPESLLELRAVELGIPRPFVGLLTAVDLRHAVVLDRTEGGITALVIVTAGLGNAANAAHPAAGRPVAVRAGTINTIVLVDAQPKQGALVNAVLTATEAKTFALLETGVHTVGGQPATGTSTDAVVIGATMRGSVHDYAGPATALGALIGATVYEAVSIAVRDAAATPAKARP